MKIRKIIFLLFFLSLTACSFAESNQHPVIKKDQGIIGLPPKIKKAVENFNPDFKMWKIEDYTPKVVNDNHQKNNPKQLPFALCVDANKNNIPDAILDGHDKKQALFIGVISEKDEYDILLIDKRYLYDPKTSENLFEGKREYGLIYYLWTLEDTKAAKRNNAVLWSHIPDKQQPTAHY
jgi:hypothetical protein